jgi:hypothetical protein
VTEDVPLLDNAGNLPARNGSPLVMASSVTSIASGEESSSGRPRISREEVQRRLMGKKGEDVEGNDAEREKVRARERENEDRERAAESMSVLTDVSAEAATIEKVEKRVVGMAHERPTTLGLSPGPSLKFDFGSRFGRGLDLNMDVGAEMVSEVGVRMEVSQVDVSMDMRSALDRLMDDVAGNSDAGPRRMLDTPDESMGTSHDCSLAATEEEEEEEGTEDAKFRQPPPIERAATDSALLPGHGLVSRNASLSSIPPTPPPKDAIRAREELFLEKRREARQRDEDESLGYYTPPKIGLGPRRSPGNMLSAQGGRPTRRRSMSTGDLQGLDDAAKRKGDMRGEGLLDVTTFRAEDDPLSDSINRELRKLESPRKSVCFEY